MVPLLLLVALLQRLPILDAATSVNSMDETWRYHLIPDEDVIHKEYVAREEAPRTSFLCPAGYFITALSYYFPLPGVLPKEEAETVRQLSGMFGLTIKNHVILELKHALALWDWTDESVEDPNGIAEDAVIIEEDSDELKDKTDVYEKHGPCPTLLYCIGFQACLFRFSIELCRLDPIPSYRKMLKVRLTCARTSQLEDYMRAEGLARGGVPKWSDQVMHLMYKSTLEKGTLELYEKTDITRVRRHKKSVFHASCPELDMARQQGYKGSCDSEPPSAPQQTEELWHILGRTLSKECASQVLQVYCAYQYNNSGSCVPPSHLSNLADGSLKFNFLAMPQTGDWPDITSYQKIFSHPHRNLIPTRLAFAILGHTSPDVLIDQLELIYRSHHYYAFHIDVLAPTTREKLRVLINKHYPTASNIRIIPEERSVRSAWGGYGIMRAELETLEELLRMGLWDHAYIISGSDLPLRDVDDLAASMAPFRGISFITINFKLNVTNEHIQGIWHCCDNHVFKVGTRVVPENVDIYSHSAFVLIARQGAELLISENRPDELKARQFFLSTTFIVDESYIGTQLIGSHLNKTVQDTSIHYLGQFEPHNMVNLCRHSDTTDACGQGPGDFRMKDLVTMRMMAHHFYLARKFRMDLADEPRRAISSNYRRGAYKESMGRFYPKSILRLLASSTLSRFPTHHQVARVGSVNNWRIISTFVHSDPCCRLMQKSQAMLTDQFKLWLDYNVFDKGDDEHNATATFAPATTYRCYPGGSIRMFHVTTRADFNDPRHRPLGINLPIPSLPSGGTAFWLQIRLSLMDIEESCSNTRATGNPGDLPYLTFPPEAEVRVRAQRVMMDVKVTDEWGVVHCGQLLPLDMNEQLINDHGPAMWFTHPISCPVIMPGTWTVTLSEHNRQNPFVYSVAVNLLDEDGHPSVYENQAVKHIDALWSVDDVMLNDKDLDRFYRTPKTSEDEHMASLKHGDIELSQQDLPTLKTPHTFEFTGSDGLANLLMESGGKELSSSSSHHQDDEL